MPIAYLLVLIFVAPIHEIKQKQTAGTSPRIILAKIVKKTYIDKQNSQLEEPRRYTNKYFILMDFLCNINSEFTIFANIGTDETPQMNKSAYR